MAGAFSGCTAIEEKKRSNQLTSRIKSYTKAIRWGDYDLATRYLRHRDGKPATTDTSRIEGVKVTHYNYEIAAPGPEAVEATMTARFDYYLPDSATIRKLKQVGVWWYDTTAQNWYLDDGLPEF
ncbi:MAG: hypothetical protein AAF458_21780 [Pseudomonadota bacterium]